MDVWTDKQIGDGGREGRGERESERERERESEHLYLHSRQTSYIQEHG